VCLGIQERTTAEPWDGQFRIDDPTGSDPSKLSDDEPRRRDQHAIHLGEHHTTISDLADSASVTRDDPVGSEVRQGKALAVIQPHVRGVLAYTFHLAIEMRRGGERGETASGQSGDAPCPDKFLNQFPQPAVARVRNTEFALDLLELEPSLGLLFEQIQDRPLERGAVPRAASSASTRHADYNRPAVRDPLPLSGLLALLLVAILPQALLALVRVDLLALALLATRHLGPPHARRIAGARDRSMDA
jgi:hypothetical protein